MSRALGLFVHSIFEDGTLAALRTPEELLDVLNKHAGRVEGMHLFFVTAEDHLNELAPVEVLAGRRFQAQINNPGRVVWNSEKGGAEVIPFTEVDTTAHERMLNRSLEERLAKVLALAKCWGLPED